jgi:hypothetical protein
MDDIKRAKARAAEDAAIAGIPADMLTTLAIAQAEFRAKGGCPGCGSKVLAVHYLPCKDRRHG